MTLIYIAGPMRGYPELNFPAFNQAAKLLAEDGYEVINPVDLNPDPSADYIDCMRNDILSLCTCDAIYLLKGWQDSEGANNEYTVARMLKLQIAFEL
jgi:Domain of unknown function (DUF4406)